MLIILKPSSSFYFISHHHYRPPRRPHVWSGRLENPGKRSIRWNRCLIEAQRDSDKNVANRLPSGTLLRKWLSGFHALSSTLRYTIPLLKFFHISLCYTTSQRISHSKRFIRFSNNNNMYIVKKSISILNTIFKNKSSREHRKERGRESVCIVWECCMMQRDKWTVNTIALPWVLHIWWTGNSFLHKKEKILLKIKVSHFQQDTSCRVPYEIDARSPSYMYVHITDKTRHNRNKLQ